ncbi:MAG: UDP-3-O-(3-hydroxymyristoyl)glucosamine N-acyltransferase [Paracoccaceae bacterium]
MTMHTIAEISEATGLAMVGDGSVRVQRPCPPDQAGVDDLAVAMSERFADRLADCPAVAAVLWKGANLDDFGLQAALLAPRPRVAMAAMTELFSFSEDLEPGIHPMANVAADAVLGVDAWVGPFAQIGPRARIGAGARIAGQVTIGADAQIGARTILRAGSRIGARCVLGENVLVHENAVIGADGFSFEPPQKGSVEAARETGAVSASNTQGFLRIHSLAAVTVGDGVEIGACTTLDRGTLADTRIGSGTKIDNQVQIGHNVQVGENCLLCAQVGIAGSATIGDRVVLGGKVGVGDHLKIGSDVICAAATMVAGNIPPQSIMMGVPAIPRDKMMRQVMALRRLPRVMDQVNEIRTKLGL